MSESLRNRIAFWGKQPLPRVTSGYLTLVFFLLPLVLHNGYLDLMETKYAFFSLVSFAYLVVMAVLWLFERSGARTDRVFWPQKKRRISAFPCFLLAFLLIFALSAACSAEPKAALYGAYNRYQGLLTVALYVLCGICVTLTARDLRLPMLALCASLFFVCLLCVLNRFSLDPICTLSALSAFDRGRFLSTLGNINACAAYLSLLFPVVLALYIGAKTRVFRILTALLLPLVFLACAVCGSESATLGLAAAILIFPVLLAEHKRALVRFCFGLFLCCFALLALHWAEALFSLDLGLSALFSFAAKPYVCLPAALLSLLFAILLARRPFAPVPRFAIPYGFVLAALLLAAFLVLLLFNTLWRDVSLGALDRFLKFNDAWGTDRGKIWRFAAQTYRAFPLPQKLIGGGAGCLYFAADADKVFADAIVDTAHNEYLQYLLTCGLCGLAAYLGIVSSALKASFSAAKTSLPVCGLWVGAFAYSVQAAVNIAHPAVTPLFFLFLALLAGAKGTGTFSSLKGDVFFS